MILTTVRFAPVPLVRTALGVVEGENRFPGHWWTLNAVREVQLFSGWINGLLCGSPQRVLARELRLAVVIGVEERDLFIPGARPRAQNEVVNPTVGLNY